MEKTFIKLTEKAMLNFPKEKTNFKIKSDKIEIEIVKRKEGVLVARAFGLDFALKKSDEPITTIDENVSIIMEKIKKTSNVKKGQQEIDNPDYIKSDLGLEERAMLEEKLEGIDEPEGESQGDEEDKEQQEIDEAKITDKNRKAFNENERTQQKSDRELSALNENMQQQQEARQKKGEERVELNLTRENSSDEALKHFIYRTMKVNAQRVIRVRTGAHTYRFEIYDHTGKDVGKTLLTPKIGGKNPRNEIWLLNNDGVFEKKEVDSLLLIQNGRYGFATDRGDGSLGDVTKSYQVTRLPGGEYIGIAALEQQKRNREPSGIEHVKDAVASKKSDHEIKDMITATKEAEKNDTIQEDNRIDIKEVKLLQFLQQEGFSREEIDCIYETIYEGMVKDDMTMADVEKVTTTVRDLKSQGCPMDKIKEIIEDAPKKDEIPDELQKTPWDGTIHRR